MENRPDRCFGSGKLSKWLIYNAANVQELLDGCLMTGNPRRLEEDR